MNPQEKYKVRLVAVNGKAAKHANDLVYFDNLTGIEARKLLDSGAADSEDRQNDAPTFERITEFLERRPEFFGHGYIVGPRREDERITLEGVWSEHVSSKKSLSEFAQLFRSADEFQVEGDYARAWYD